MQPTACNISRSLWLACICVLLSGCTFSRLTLGPHRDLELPIPYTYSNTGETQQDLNGLLVSGSDIWVIGNGGYISHSADAGKGWKESPVVEGDLLSILRDRQGIMIVSGRGGSVLKSTDHGATWERSETNVTADLFGSFANASSIFAVGDKGTIIASDDSARSWKQIPFSKGDSVLRSITSSSDGSLLIVTTDGGEIFRGDRNGKGWSRVWLGNSGAINFVTSNENGSILIAVGEHGTILRSDDFGLNWVPISNTFSRGLVSVIYSPVLQAFLAVGGDGLLARSNETGTSWTRQVLPTNRTLRGIQITADAKLFAAGSGGVIVGGTAPQYSVYRGDPIRLNGLLDTKRFGLLGFGQNGTLIHITETGKAGQMVSVSTDNALNSLAEFDSGLWAAGEHGTIAYSRDAIHWVLTSGMPDVQFNTVASTEDGHFVYVGGDGGIIVSSSDYGKSWTQSVPAPQHDIKSIAIQGQSTFAGGSGGLLMTSSLGSKSWAIEPQDVGYTFNAILASPKGPFAWAFGSAGAVFYSHDNGKTWDYDGNDVTESFLSAVCIQQCAQIVAVGEQGTTAFRGKTDDDWAYTSKTRFDIRSITATRSGQVYALGSNFTIFRPANAKGAWQTDELSSDISAAFIPTDGHRLWLTGDSGTIWHSSDSGAHWTTTHLQTASSLNSIVGDNLGINLIAVGAKGVVGRSRDGGGSWTLTTLSPNSLLTVRQIGQDTWAVGSRGAIYKSVAGSEQWTTYPSVTTNSLWDIGASPDGRSLWAIGNNGTIVNSMNGGETWTEQSVGMPS